MRFVRGGVIISIAGKWHIFITFMFSWFHADKVIRQLCQKIDMAEVKK